MIDAYDRAVTLYSQALDADPEGPAGLLLLIAKRLRKAIFAKTVRKSAKRSHTPRKATPKKPTPGEQESKPPVDRATAH